MNSSDLVRRALAYLGCRTSPDDRLVSLVGECLAEAERLAHFRAVGEVFSRRLSFLQNAPYLQFLEGCAEYALVAMTLGSEAELRVRALMKVDPARAVVLDACASALVEAEGDKWEERFGKNRTFRFCPGYGGSSVSDNAFIFEALRPERIGMQLLPSGMMAPQKSMAGIIGIGKQGTRTCSGCMAAAGCKFFREGGVCYRSEQSSS